MPEGQHRALVHGVPPRQVRFGDRRRRERRRHDTRCERRRRRRGQRGLRRCDERRLRCPHFSAPRESPHCSGAVVHEQVCDAHPHCFLQERRPHDCAAAVRPLQRVQRAQRRRVGLLLDVQLPAHCPSALLHRRLRGGHRTALLPRVPADIQGHAVEGRTRRVGHTAVVRDGDRALAPHILLLVLRQPVHNARKRVPNIRLGDVRVDYGVAHHSRVHSRVRDEVQDSHSHSHSALRVLRAVVLCDRVRVLVHRSDTDEHTVAPVPDAEDMARDFVRCRVDNNTGDCQHLPEAAGYADTDTER